MVHSVGRTNLDRRPIHSFSFLPFKEKASIDLAIASLSYVVFDLCLLHVCTCSICVSMFVPEGLLKTVLVPLPKKYNAKECKDYGTILSVMLQRLSQSFY